LDLKTLQINDVKTKGNKPCDRYGHGSEVLNNSLFIFGGHSSFDDFNDFYKIDLETLLWEQIKIEGVTP